MIKLIYKLFKRKLNKLVFEENIIHANWKDKCKVYYIDGNGLSYYQYINPLDLPTERYEYLIGLVSVYEMGFNTKDYKSFLESFEKEINETVNNPDHRGKGLAKIMTLVHELSTRSEIRLEPTTLLEMMAVVLIREDENPELIDHKVLDSKVEQFKKDKKHYSAGFFLQAGLNTYVPSLVQLQENWMTYMNQSMQEVKMSNEILDTLFKKSQTELSEMPKTE